MIYRIRVKNHVEEYWSHWFGNMQVTHLESGESVLAGPVEDQEQLHHILEKIRDLNLVLLSIERAENDLDQPQTSIKQEGE